jgi:hypothetical protein
MAVRTADERVSRAWTPAIVPFIVAAVIFLVVLAVGASLLNDPDTFWHIAVGDWILANGFPTGDPFSFTFAGAPWIAKEWLSQLVLTSAYHLGGWPLVVVISAAAFALAFALLARFLMDELAPLPVIALVAVAFILAAPHLVARPHVLALPVMVAWVGGLVRAVDRSRPPPYALLLLMVLWANLHGGFTLGIVLTIAAGLDAVVSARPGDRRRLAGRWLVFVILTLVAASITPYGPQSMLVTYRILSQTQALSIIGEWRPADFSHLAAFELVLLAGAGFVLYRGFVLPPVRVLVLLGLLHLALSAERNGELLGLLTPLFLAAPLARQLPGTRAAGAAPAASARLGMFAAATLGTVALLAGGLAVAGGDTPNPRIAPSAAVAVIKRNGFHRVLNDYDFGGYLIFSGVAPFIDGRTELYGDAFTMRHYRAVNLVDLNDFVRILNADEIDATLLKPTTPAVALLDRLPGWKRLYADDVAVVHVRDAH